MTNLDYRPYTGIGSRSTPLSALSCISFLAEKLDALGFTLRSGAAPGADAAFEKAASRKEIFLPWKGFNGSDSEIVDQSAEAFDIASSIHPNWSKLSAAGRRLHARNCHQVLGRDLNSPSLFVLCWTQNAMTVGGSATAINLARASNIPVINLGLWQMTTLETVWSELENRIAGIPGIGISL